MLIKALQSHVNQYLHEYMKKKLFLFTIPNVYISKTDYVYMHKSLLSFVQWELL